MKSLAMMDCDGKPLEVENLEGHTLLLYIISISLSPDIELRKYFDSSSFGMHW
jgi:hypothetical protein